MLSLIHIYMPRLSIVAGVHGDELQGQYICYELIRRIKEEREHLRGIVDVYPPVYNLALTCFSLFLLEVLPASAPSLLSLSSIVSLLLIKNHYDAFEITLKTIFYTSFCFYGRFTY